MVVAVLVLVVQNLTSCCKGAVKRRERRRGACSAVRWRKPRPLSRPMCNAKTEGESRSGVCTNRGLVCSCWSTTSCCKLRRDLQRRFPISAMTSFNHVMTSFNYRVAIALLVAALVEVVILQLLRQAVNEAGAAVGATRPVEQLLPRQVLQLAKPTKITVVAAVARRQPSSRAGDGWKPK